MRDLDVIRVFSALREEPEKYLRISIGSTGGCIHLPGNQVHLSISQAMLAKFVDHNRIFYYSYDSQTSKLDPEFKCLVAMKKNKELAYISGSKDDLLSGYIRCKAKNKDNEYVEDFEDENDKADSIFFGIVTTKLFTIVLAADNKHTKTLQIELLRPDENQPSLEDIILTLNHLSQDIDREVHDGQEE